MHINPGLIIISIRIGLNSPQQ